MGGCGKSSTDRLAAMNELFHRLGKDYEKPEWDIHELELDGEVVPVAQLTELETPFCRLLRFKRHSNDGARVEALLAQPAVPAQALLASSALDTVLTDALATVAIAPCWTLMVAFPQALQPTLSSLGPQWNVARSTHHRIAWLARESSKPGRGPVERWTVQANPAWSQRHLEDSAERVKGKLLKAFTEVTGIHAEPPYAAVHRWRYAQTTKPLGKTHGWDAQARIGVCGDWCLGHRVEDGFVSGLEMALAIL